MCAHVQPNAYVDPTNDITETNIYPVYIPRSTACEDRFYNYLKNTAKLSGNSCESYITSIRSAERYAFFNGITSHRLFSEDKDEIIALTPLCHNIEGSRRSTLPPVPSL